MRFGFAMTVAAVMAATPASAKPASADLVIRHATIVDVAGGKARPGQAIAIRGKDIVAVGPDGSIARRY